MFREIDTKDAKAVRSEVDSIYQKLFPSGTGDFVLQAFEWFEASFSGRYDDYLPIDTKYHDQEHTLQVTLCFVRLLEGYKVSKAIPELTQRAFELGLLAILLHDTGYLKKRGDTSGTGAKYTLVHVARSAEFATRLLKEKGFPDEDIQSVRNMIRCTGVNVDLKGIPFQNELERKIAFALGTADLLGQMAANDYIEKLETLYQEFEESNRFNGKVTGPGVFSSAEDLKRKTPLFWEKYVLPKITNDFLGMYQLLNDPADGVNEYLERVQSNIARLQEQLKTAMA